jgi:DNA-binding NtrC family response regulator
MPARIVLVHDGSDFLRKAAAAIRAAGYEVAAFDRSMAALDALRNGQSVQLLITRVEFPPGSPHGVSLANVARNKIPNLKVLFIARPEHRRYTDGASEFMPAPVSIPELIDRVSELLPQLH